MTQLVEMIHRAAAGVRRNERLVARLLIGTIVLFCVGFLTPSIRDRVLDRAQVAMARWDARWTERVERGEALVNEGRYEEAAVQLTRLDRIFPARHVKHRRDTERERVLHALGRANLELGRKRASLDAFQKAVDFDPRNFMNHFALAEAALALGEEELALAAFERALAINPGYFPAVAALIGFHFEGADYRAVMATYEAYLDAPVMQSTAVQMGDATGYADARVDGLPHEIEVPLGTGETTDPVNEGRLTIDAGPHPIEIANVLLLPRRRAGAFDSDPVLLRPPSATLPGDVHGDQAPNIVEVPIPTSAGAIARARIALILRKTVDPETWKMVEVSYRNLLELNALEVARRRSAITATAAGGSAL